MLQAGGIAAPIFEKIVDKIFADMCKWVNNEMLDYDDEDDEDLVDDQSTATPVPTTFPKRMAEEEEEGNSKQFNKRKAVIVEHKIDDLLDDAGGDIELGNSTPNVNSITSTFNSEPQLDDSENFKLEFACIFPSCTASYARRDNAVRHVKTRHLKDEALKMKDKRAINDFVKKYIKHNKS